MDYLLTLAKFKQDTTNEQAVIKNEQIKNIIETYIKPLDAIVFNNKYMIETQRYKFVIYARNPRQIANELSNVLYRDFSKYVISKTKLCGREYDISINNENTATIIRFIPMIQGEYRIPCSIHNVVVLKLMYNINQYYDLDTNGFQQTITNCINQCETRLKQLENVKPLYIKKYDLKSFILQKFYTYMRQELKNDILSLSYTDDIQNNSNTIDVLHSMDIIFKDPIVKNNIINKIDNILDKSHFTNYKIETNEHSNFYISMDFRLRKTSIYVIAKNDKKNKNIIYLVNLYNAATYDILPVITGTYGMVPSPLVILRFMYIDLYFMETNDSCALYLLTNILTVLKQYEESSDELTRVNDWFGFIVDENFVKICAKLRAKLDTSDYIPAEYFELHKKLRKI